MDYNAPLSQQNPDAPYLDMIPGTQKGSPVPGKAVEYPQREIVNVIKAAGIVPTNTDLTQLLQAIRILSQQAMLEYYLCRHIFQWISDDPRPGEVPVIGTLIEDAAELYPKAFAFLQTPIGQKLCTTESEWQAARQVAWATLASGEKITWNNIGGICKYVIDTMSGTIRVPDLRGMYPEIAGYDLLGVGMVDGDRQRNLQGNIEIIGVQTNDDRVFYGTNWSLGTPVQSLDYSSYHTLNFETSKFVPIGVKNAPRHYGVLGCVYLGQGG